MKRILLYFHFYKRKFIFPLIAAIFALIYTEISTIAIITLIAATILIWFYERYLNDRKKESLYFYLNLGVSELKLYTFLCFVNLIILIGFNMYMK